jgi:membrane protein DedA with SNARE-associated domain
MTKRFMLQAWPSRAWIIHYHSANHGKRAHMDIALLIARYGYLAVLAGTLLEGETVLLLAGYAAHRGYLDLALVMGVGWLGAVLGDQVFFWLGRHHARRLLDTRPALNAEISRALGWIEGHPDLAILTMRFLWGLRTALPVALGMGRVSWWKFFWLNALSAAVWVALITGAGWSFGALIARHAPAWHRYEHWGMAAVVALAMLAYGWRRWRARTSRLTQEPPR